MRIARGSCSDGYRQNAVTDQSFGNGAHPPPFVCHTPARKRRGPALYPGTFGAREQQDHGNIHTYHQKRLGQDTKSDRFLGFLKRKLLKNLRATGSTLFLYQTNYQTSCPLPPDTSLKPLSCPLRARQGLLCAQRIFPHCVIRTILSLNPQCGIRARMGLDRQCGTQEVAAIKKKKIINN
jgi:hypothetical protein